VRRVEGGMMSRRARSLGRGGGLVDEGEGGGGKGGDRGGERGGDGNTGLRSFLAVLLLLLLCRRRLIVRNLSGSRMR